MAVFWRGGGVCRPCVGERSALAEVSFFDSMMLNLLCFLMILLVVW